MSLLTHKAPHTIQVQNREYYRDEQGMRVARNVGQPITVKGMAEPVREWSSAEESHANGLQIIDLILWRSREYPGNTHSHILYEGEWYESSGAPQHFNSGRRTRHYRVTLRRITNEV